MDALDEEQEEMFTNRDELPSLPPYDGSRFLSEYLKPMAIAVAVLAITVTFIFWKFVRSREDQMVQNLQSGNVSKFLKRGQFNRPVLGNIRRAPPAGYLEELEEHECASRFDELSAEKPCTDEDTDSDCSETQEEGLEENKETPNVGDKPQPKSFFDPASSERVKDGEDENARRPKDAADIDLMATFGKLHGKLATAQLHAKTNKMEKEMSQEQREEERRIRAQQLETIFEMMRADTEKFGLQDKSELLEQMKLYSV